MSNKSTAVVKAYLAPAPDDTGVERFVIGEGETTIGRNPTNDVHLGRGAVSRFHAKIEYKSGEFVLTDLNSSNGTFLNNHRVKQVRLRNSDAVRFGDRLFQFQIENAAEAAPTGSMTFSPKHAVRVHGQKDTQPIQILARDGESAAEVLLSADDDSGRVSETQALLAHKRVAILYHLSNDLRMAQEADAMLSIGMDVLFDALPAERGVALLQTGLDEPFEPRVIRRRRDDSQEAVPVSQTVIESVVKAGHGLICRDALIQPEFKAAESIWRHDMRSILCVPLIASHKAIGAIQMDTSETAAPFTQYDLDFAAAAAAEIAISIENLRLSREAVRNERMAAIGLTIANVAHNIKNTLTLNQGAIELMDRAVSRSKDGKIQKNWVLVRQCLTHMSDLATDMLNYSSPKSVQIQPVDVNKVILDNLNIFEECLSQRGVVLELELAEALPDWKIDEIGLQRALVNLIVNASDAIDRPDGGEITLTTRLDQKNRLQVSVTDNGCGIPDDSMRDVFELFFTTKKTRGTGLGLPMVQKYVESMGGEVTLESRFGVGSTFTMIFPGAAEGADA